MRKKISCFVLFFTVFLLGGCVDQHPQQSAAVDTNAEISLEITDAVELKAVQQAKAWTRALTQEPRIIATSPAVAQICERLNLDLVGVCTSSVSSIPERYKDAAEIGTAMSVDMEVTASLQPDWILSPSSLQTDLQPKYEAIDTQWAFLNLKSVTGMYRSIQELGEIFDRQEEASEMLEEFNNFYKEYREKNQTKEKSKVLILMGLPGSYVIATENSYVGSLVEMAGGENVYAGSNQEFLNVNTEDMKQKEPDIILRTAHALPEQVMEMFKEDFESNAIWKHFDAVANGRVYDLSYEYFGMSATFEYPKALEELQSVLYPDTQEEK